MNPLKRQYFVKGEICDVLAVDDSRQLVVLELKNSEDRYIVQQLTRYYDKLLEEKPFKEDVNYNTPVRLVAVTLIFHKHNLIDRKYTNLELEFLQFEVLTNEQKFYFQLKSTDGNQVSQVEIPYREIDLASIGDNIPTPPNLLLEWLGSYSSEKQEAILKIRGHILSFAQRIQEITDIKSIKSKSIKYDIGKTKLCAEFSFERKLKKIILFLWLPIPNRKRKAISRMQIGTQDWSTYWAFGHIPNGIGKMEIGRMTLYYLVKENERVRGYLDELVEESLETWLERF